MSKKKKAASPQRGRSGTLPKGKYLQKYDAIFVSITTNQVALVKWYYTPQHYAYICDMPANLPAYTLKNFLSFLSKSFRVVAPINIGPGDVQELISTYAIQTGKGEKICLS